MFTTKSAAKKLLEDTKKIYAGSHCYKVINPQDFSHLDLKFYDTSMREMEAEKFRHIADVENLTLKESSMNPQTFLRIGLSSDGTMTSVLYQVKPKLWIRFILWLSRAKLSKAIEFETEFNDGSFVTTSNAKMAALLDTPPLIYSEFLPDEKSVNVLFTKHQERISEHIELSNAQPIELLSLKDILESQHRMEEIKSNFRKGIGWMKKSEWDRITDNSPLANETVSNEIYEEFQNLNDKTAY